MTRDDLDQFVSGQGDWQEHLRECVLFGILYKATIVDLDLMRHVPLKLSYHVLLEDLSRWAEKWHFRLKRSLQEKGCVLLKSEKQGTLYCVQTRMNGYLREAVYSTEILRSECQNRVHIWMLEQTGGNP